MQDSFFYLCGCSLKKKKELNNLIHGAFGRTWDHNFYMGMQNGSKLNLMKFLIHAFELVIALEYFPMFV